MIYSEYVTALSGLLVLPAADPQFLAILPRAIDDAEGRIYKDMDFLAANETDNMSRDFIAGNREVALPSLFITVENLGYVSGGVTTFLREVSLEVLNMAYPARTAQGTPLLWARKDHDVVAVGPAPSSTDDVEFTGLVRPAPLSASNTLTYISEHHSELLIAASMVFMTGYQKNFGAQAEDPKMGLSWESVYQSRLKSSLAEEARRQGQGPRS